MVRTICYGLRDDWEDRKAAIDCFEEAMIATAGSAESERYARVLANLMLGKEVCADYEEDYEETRQVS